MSMAGGGWVLEQPSLPINAMKMTKRSRCRMAGLLTFGQLLDFLLGHALNPRQEALHLPLRGVIGEDELLRLRAVGDIGDPVVEARRPPPHHRQSAEPHALP